MTARAGRTIWSMPTMVEVLAREPLDLRVASTFSGAGGGSLGLRLAGAKAGYASEFVPEAAECYRNNFGLTPDGRDIRDVPADEILEALGCEKGEVDILEGSPPCSPFSVAGKRSEGWGKVSAYSTTKQRSDDLFLEYLRLIEGLKPKTFMAENVAGITIGKAKGFFKNVLKSMAELGYNVAAYKIKGSESGVAQIRTRVFFVGVRKDIARSAPRPRPNPHRWTIREAFRALPEENPVHDFAWLRPALRAAWIRVGHDGSNSEDYFNLIRSDWDKPSGTLLQSGHSAAGPSHPDIPRFFTVEETRILMGFPSDFWLPEHYKRAIERMNRAVAPPAAYRVAVSLIERIGLDPHLWSHETLALKGQP